MSCRRSWWGRSRSRNHHGPPRNRNHNYGADRHYDDDNHSSGHSCRRFWWWGDSDCSRNGRDDDCLPSITCNPLLNPTCGPVCGPTGNTGAPGRDGQDGGNEVYVNFDTKYPSGTKVPGTTNNGSATTARWVIKKDAATTATTSVPATQTDDVFPLTLTAGTLQTLNVPLNEAQNTGAGVMNLLLPTLASIGSAVAYKALKIINQSGNVIHVFAGGATSSASMSGVGGAGATPGQAGMDGFGKPATVQYNAGGSGACGNDVKMYKIQPGEVVEFYAGGSGSYSWYASPL